MVPHCKWASQDYRCKLPHPHRPWWKEQKGQGLDQVGKHPQSRRKLPGPWLSASLVVRMGLGSSLYSTYNPIHPWRSESCLPGGLSCCFFRGEVGCACILPFPCCPNPRTGAPHMEKSEPHTAHEQSDGPTAHYRCKVTEGGGGGCIDPDLLGLKLPY